MDFRIAGLGWMDLDVVDCRKSPGFVVGYEPYAAVHTGPAPDALC